MSKHKCSYKGCQRNPGVLGRSFFRFPVQDDDRCLEWILRSGNDEFQDLPALRLREKRICSLHFSESDFQNALRKKLNKNAFPVMFQPAIDIHSDRVSDRVDSVTDPPSKPSQDPLTSSTIHAIDESTTNTKTEANDNSINRVTKRNNKLTKKIQNVKLKLLRKTTLFPEINNRLSGAPLTFVKSQLRVGKKVDKWTEDEKKLGLALFYRSPKSYRAMLRLGFQSPSVRAVKEWVNLLHVRPGISSELFSKLESSVKVMDRREKQCVLIFDEMTIKKWLNYNRKFDCVEGFEDLGELGRSGESASHALVFMVRGLTYNWKIPVAYYLSASAVKAKKLIQLLHSVIESLTKIGLRIRAFVCDQGSSNQKLFCLLKLSIEKPFILVGDKKIYALFDSAHLIKSLRNNLLNHDFVIEGKVVSWKAFRLLFITDSRSLERLAPKLSMKHVYLKASDKMNVKLATQVFSDSVHAALLSLAATTPAGVERDLFAALGNFTGKINQIFDAMNSRTLHDQNPNRKALSVDNTRSTDILRDALQWLPRLHISDPTVKDPPTFNHFSLTITSILQLWEDLKSEGVKYLLTSRLQQDPVENLFSIIRQRVSYGVIPTATQFRQNLQQVISNRLLIPPKSAEREDDNDSIIDIGSLSAQTQTKEPNTVDVSTNDMELDEHDRVDCKENNIDRVERDRVADLQSDGCRDEVELATEELPEENNITSLEDNATYYFSGFSVKKTIAKFNCDRCRETLHDRRQESVTRKQVLRFFKAYPTKDQAPLGNLVASSEEYWQVASQHLRLFVQIYPVVRSRYNVVQLLIDNIVDQDSKSRKWFSGDCREHRIFLLRTLLTSRLVRGLQWPSIESCESRKRFSPGNLGSNSSAVKKFKGQ